MSQNSKKRTTNDKNTQRTNPAQGSDSKNSASVSNVAHKGSTLNGNPTIDAAISKMADPTLAAAARVSLAASTSVDTMCEVIKVDPHLSTDEKLQRLRSVNEIEQGNKEQAHRMAKESATQQGVLTIVAIGLVFGLGILLSAGRVKPVKVA